MVVVVVATVMTVVVAAASIAAVVVSVVVYPDGLLYGADVRVIVRRAVHVSVDAAQCRVKPLQLRVRRVSTQPHM